MKIIDLLLDTFDYLIGKVPILGSIKRAIEKEYPSRILTTKELKTDKWLKRLCQHLNKIFEESHYPLYTTQKIKEWIDIYEETFIVIVRRKIFSLPLNSEKIVSTVKVLPLNDLNMISQNFEPFNVTGDNLVANINKAKAIWIGDLTSSKHELITLLLALKHKSERINKPLFCRTAIKQLRSILFERYGGQVFHPDGSDADGKTILVLYPKFRVKA